MTSRGLRIATLALTLLTTGPVARVGAATPPVQASLERDAPGDRLSLAARNAPIGEVLAEVARQAGFQVSEIVPLADRRISLVLEAVRLERALEQLLAGESFALVYSEPPDGPPRLSRVLLLGPQTPAAGAARGPTPARAPTTPTADAGSADEPPRILPEDAEAFDPDGPLDQLLFLAEHRDYRMRVSALEALSGRGDDPRARQTILDHVRDPHPRVRDVALGLLAPQVATWPGAEEAIWAALRDLLAPIRQAALVTLWEASSARVPEALRLGLQDVDPEVRALAEALSRQEPGGVTGVQPAPPAAAADPAEPVEVPAE